MKPSKPQFRSEPGREDEAHNRRLAAMTPEDIKASAAKTAEFLKSRAKPDNE